MNFKGNPTDSGHRPKFAVQVGVNVLNEFYSPVIRLQNPEIVFGWIEGHERRLRKSTFP